MVPLLDGMLGAEVPALTWFGAFISILGVGMLESSGSPPCVGVVSRLSIVTFDDKDIRAKILRILCHFKWLAKVHCLYTFSPQTTSGWRSFELLKCCVFWCPYAED